MTTRICFIRHGETDWNVERRIQGQHDVPLNANGHAQARAVAQALRERRFAAIYTSDLLRARDTAEALARLAGLAVCARGGLRERHFGVLQGLTAEERSARYPAEQARLKARDPDYVLPGGESLAGFARRVMACIDDIVAAHAGAELLIATHGGVLDVVHRRATGRPLTAPRDFDIPNCALNWIEADPRGWTLGCWGDSRHLQGALDELPG